ncbi:transglycosylase SLT domain-containing protein [Glutamicibacter arilaitensis]|uniref:transglycosylase SLT domain-containing protein n=1 Tax=Glutamicibacter arilaitensis TaxID=256701 RepID=UPI003FD5333F
MKKGIGLISGLGFMSFLLLIVLLFVVISSVAGSQYADEQNPENQNTLSCQADGQAIPEKYREDIARAAEVSTLSPAIHAAQIEAESNWNEKAVSPVGAGGLTQFMPSTWAAFGQGDRFNGHDAIAAQGRYLKYLVDYMNNSGLVGKDGNSLTELVLAGYNAGQGNVTEHGGIPPFAETRGYLQKVMNLAQTKYSESGSCKPIDDDTTELIDFEKSGKWVSPLPGSSITSRYGKRPCPTNTCNYDTIHHQGLDLSTGGGGKNTAPVDMEIIHAGKDGYWSQWYGPWILGKQIDGEGFYIEMHHCAEGSVKVRKGQKVAAGTQVCIEGATGNARGAHNHFQIGKPDFKATGDVPTRRHTLDPEPILIEKRVL